MRKLTYQIARSVFSFFSNIRWSVYPMWFMYSAEGYRIRGTDIDRCVRMLRSGDILLRGYDKYPASVLIGHWSHVGVYVGEGVVIHAIGSGVVQEHILDFMRTDRVCILRTELSDSDIGSVVASAKRLVGTPYDFLFSFSDGREVSCTEFLYKLMSPYGDVVGVQLKDGWFGKVLLPKDFLANPKLRLMLMLDPSQQRH